MQPEVAKKYRLVPGQQASVVNYRDKHGIWRKIDLREASLQEVDKAVALGFGQVEVIPQKGKASEG